MMQTVRCIKFGEILLDKNRSPFLLCQNCHADFVDLIEFRKHLEACNGLENFFRKNAALIFDSTKGTQLFGRGATGEFKEYRVYEPCEVQNIEAVEQPTMIVKENYIDLIEEELMDPRWYTDIGQQPTILTTETTEKVLAYNELVEAVTPYVQFKENVKTNCKPNIITTPSSSSNNNVANMPTVRQSKAAWQKNVEKQVITRHSISSNTKKNVNVNNTDIATTISNKPSPVTTIILSLDPLTSEHGQQQQTQTVLNIPIEAAHAETEFTLKKATVNVGHSKAKVYQRPVVQAVKAITTNPVPPLARLSLPPPNATLLPPAAAIATKAYIPKPPLVQSTVRRSSHGQRSSQSSQHTRSMPKHTQSPVKRSTQHAMPMKHANAAAAVINGHTTPLHSLPVPALAPVQLQPSLPLPPPPPPPPALAAPKTKQTEQILNKLQTLGLQVKRTNPTSAEHKSLANAIEVSKTDELLKKLRSKGMNVKLLNKNNDKTRIGASATGGTATPAKRAKLDTTTTNAAATAQSVSNNKSNLNKNIIIRKVK